MASFIASSDVRSATLVSDALSGLLKSRQGALKRLNLSEGLFVIIDEKACGTSRSGDAVALLGGGGAGHEPCFADLVGQGLLTAAISGQIFTSPSASAIEKGIRHCAGQKGFILFVLNYTGDNLNFEAARKRLCVDNSSPVPNEIVTIADDVTTCHAPIGGRGLSGATIIMKLGGALASDADNTVSFIATHCRDAAARLKSIGVSLTSCRIPGRHLDSEGCLPRGSCEIGLGLHGEAGVERCEQPDLDQLVSRLLTRLKEAFPPDIGSQHKMVVLLNNLGAVSELEMHVISEILLTKIPFHFGLSVERFACAKLATSFDMFGFSISIFYATPAEIKLLDQPTSAAAWPNFCCPLEKSEEFMIAPYENSVLFPKSVQGDSIEQSFDGMTLAIEPSVIEECLRSACESLLAQEALLNDADWMFGDGDTGATFARFAKACMQQSAKIAGLPLPGLFSELAKMADEHMGGTSGGIYFAAFSCCARYWETSGDNGVGADFTGVFDAGMRGVMDLTGTRESGTRSMMDPIVAVSQHIKKNAFLDLPEIIDVVKSATANTRSMKNRVGRGAYALIHEDTALPTKLPDAGALAFQTWFVAVLEVIQRQRIRANKNVPS